MTRRAICLALTLLLGAPALAAPPTICSSEPAGAVPAPAGDQRHMETLWQRLRLRAPIRQVEGFSLPACVTSGALFYADDWIDPADMDVPSPNAVGFAALAYLLGVQQHHFGPAAARRGPDPDASGAWLTGCALARLNVRGDALMLRAQAIEALTGPRTDAAAWMTHLQGGHEQCDTH